MLFDDVKVLIVLSEAKSLSQAADKLYMSRPGLSQKITNLESRFGTKLIERTSTGIKMTRAGRLACDFARNVSDLERTMAARLAAIDESFNPSISVGMSLNDGVALLPKLVASYVGDEGHDEYIHLDAGYEPHLVEKLREGKLSFAVMENQPQEPGLNVELLGYKKLVFIGPNKPPYNKVIHPLPVETLLQWPMIIYEWESGRHMVGNRHFRERYGYSLNDHNIIACFDTHEAMVEGVKAGLGWGSVPECVYQKCKDDPAIVRFKVNTPPMWYPVSIAWSTEHDMNDNAREFLGYVRAHVPENYFRRDIEAMLNS